MVARPPFLRRSGRRFGFVRIVFFIALTVIVLVLIGMPRTDSAMSRINVVLATDPISVWSWDRIEKTLTVVTIPSDVVVDTIGGYGKYTLEASWKLGFIDKRGGEVLTQSISDALAIPVRWYAGEQTDTLPQTHDVLLSGSRFFSYGSVLPLMLGKYHTNIPVPLFLTLVHGIATVAPQDLAVIRLDSEKVTVKEDVPDGTQRNVLVKERLDAVLERMFEDIRIRKEALTVGVYNTTGLPSVANRSARTLSAIGMLVVFVGNDEPEISKCEIVGREDKLRSLTARVIRELFDCNAIIRKDQQANDVIVRLGSSVATRFK